MALGVGCATRAPEAAAPPARPVELALRTAQGRELRLGELRGKPTLLFVFTTFDKASQYAWIPLRAVAERHEELVVLGIAVQPDPQVLLPLYQRSLDIPFVLAFAPEGSILTGDSTLGPIEAVPTYLKLDRRGRITARHTGVATQAELEAMLE